MTNKQFANDFLELAKKVIIEVSEIDPDDPNAAVKLAKAQEKNAAIKQANNTYRSALQHDVARAKLENYKSSFLDKDA
ncbi:MAG: hypothetical protein AAF741_15725 [Bacteroidota bacterium]